jgi:hypothetical protein
MKRKYFDQKTVFEHIWQCADRDGIWDGDDATLAIEFAVSEDEAHSMLADLCNRRLIENFYPGKFAIMKWSERDVIGHEV